MTEFDDPVRSSRRVAPQAGEDRGQGSDFQKMEGQGVFLASNQLGWVNCYRLGLSADFPLF